MKRNPTNVNTSGLSNCKGRCPRLTAPEIDSPMPVLTDGRLRCLACLCLVGTMALVADRYARADADDGRARILSFENDSVVTTVPGNGDVNPCGVAFVPPSFPRGGCLGQATSWCRTSMTWLTSKGQAPRSSMWRKITELHCFSRGMLRWA